MMSKGYRLKVDIEAEVREQLLRLTPQEKLVVAELAGLSRMTIYNCVSAKKFNHSSYVKIKDALPIFLRGDYSPALADVAVQVAVAEFMLDLKFACKSTAVSSRIEAEYYVNPELAAWMLREAETIEDCNAILDGHFGRLGFARSSSLARMEI